MIVDITTEVEKKPLIEQRADPCIYYHSDGYYYFTASAPEFDRIELRRSFTISGLAKTQPKIIWRKHAEGPMSYHIWAPELHFINGKWFIYFAAGQNRDHWYIRTWILECDSADPFFGEWKEKGQLVTEWDSFTLDMTVFQHAGGLYACWAQKRKERTENSALYIAKMPNPYTIETPQTLISVPEYEWETCGHKVNEGPFFLERNGKCFITYSASATDHTYCIGLLWAESNSNLLCASSWHKLEKPVFVTNEKDGIFGPGHSCFTTSRDGKQDYLVYHARPYREVDLDFALYDPNRHAWIKQFSWDKNGFPVFQ